ncbi:MAG: sodium ion-translocating decarboxylase subunit beta, partial [Lachnospiraceae bacterium]|nr:sodium ion-translocating decarboxylase subunit beta [Lachnospiraceae bacterium]
MQYVVDTLGNLAKSTAFASLTWGNLLMIGVALVFMYLAIAKDYEPLLLVPISFGMLLVNMYPSIMAAPIDHVYTFYDKAGDKIACVKEEEVEFFNVDKDDITRYVISFQDLDAAVKDGNEKANSLKQALEETGEPTAALLEQFNSNKTDEDKLRLGYSKVYYFDKDGKILLEYQIEQGERSGYVCAGSAKMEDTKQAGGLLHYFFLLDEWAILPCLIFMGVGAMTDFGPLIANPKSFLLGASAQLGIFAAYLMAIAMGFNDKAAAAISIIGGADGPTSIFLTSKLSPKLLGAVAVAAYSYMALVPIIQPPIMKLLTSEAERK